MISRRMPLRLKSRAETLARRSGYASVPDGRQDALRHLIGSALFTRAYGSLLSWLAGELAELIAWIVGHNSATQREMDLHNNSIGREIGRQADTEDEVVRLAHRAVDLRRARWIVEDDDSPLN